MANAHLARSHVEDAMRRLLDAVAETRKQKDLESQETAEAALLRTARPDRLQSVRARTQRAQG
jgi:hypothetical protein